MKPLAIAMMMIAAATLPAAATELQRSRPLTENVSTANDSHVGNRIDGSDELARGRLFDRHAGKLSDMSCVGGYIGGWTEGYPGTQNAC
jgi:hypothetical protein